MSNNNTGFETRCIHAGQSPEATTGAVMTPIYATSTFVQKSPGQHSGYEYSRCGNPTRDALERSIADLEGGEAGFAFASGLAAMATVLELLDQGDEIVSMDDLYGGSYRLLENVRTRSAGVVSHFIDMTNIDAIEAAINKNTRMIWVETPTNPNLKVLDLVAIADLAKRHRLISVCDNTFASPILQRPLELGFDISLHSATKYINGHSDIIAGLAVTRRNSEYTERLRFLHNAVGSILSPFDSFLCLRGIKTLPLRMARHCENALKIAQFLERHKSIERVIYPGLPSHKQYELAKRQMDAFGGIVTIVVRGGLKAAQRMLERIDLFLLAESLGGVESLIEHPAIMTHASIPAEKRAQFGIVDGLVRLSVGIETSEDLIADLDQALK